MTDDTPPPNAFDHNSTPAEIRTPENGDTLSKGGILYTRTARGTWLPLGPPPTPTPAQLALTHRPHTREPTPFLGHGPGPGRCLACAAGRTLEGFEVTTYKRIDHIHKVRDRGLLEDSRRWKKEAGATA